MVSYGGKIEDGIEVEEFDFKHDINCYKYDKGIFTFDKSKKTQMEQDTKILDLRSRRESECFSIVNRGHVWYKTLTDKQIEELDAWYKDWLKVTNTFKVPKRPSFL